MFSSDGFLPSFTIRLFMFQWGIQGKRQHQPVCGNMPAFWQAVTKGFSRNVDGSVERENTHGFKRSCWDSQSQKLRVKGTSEP